MAFPIRLFDPDTKEGVEDAKVFFHNLDQVLTKNFGIVQPAENNKKFVRLTEVPDFLKRLGHKTLKDILDRDPKTKELVESKDTFSCWKASVGMYGRKVGSMIKRDSSVLYRIVINVGDIEIYHLDSEMFKEPAVLPNTYALLCSPNMVSTTDLKVQSDPHRKNLSKDILSLVPRLRPRNYMRCTIVLDLPVDLPDLPMELKTNVDSKTLDFLSSNPTGDEGMKGCSGECKHEHEH